MFRSVRTRIETLEEKATPPTRKVCLWEDGTGSAEREIERLKAHGEADDVDFITFCWLPTVGPTDEMDEDTSQSRTTRGT